MSARPLLMNKQGRPPKDKAGLIGTLAWFRSVQRKSGKTSVELGREFHPNDYCYDGEKQKTSHRWERYEAGTNSPTDNKTGKSLIDIVEIKYAGTAYWFRHLIWIALGQSVQSLKTINSLLSSLNKSVVDICFVPQEIRGRVTLTRTPYDYGIPTKLSYLRCLDGLAALLLLAKEAELIGNGRMHAQVMIHVPAILFHLKNIPEFLDVMEDVVDCLNVQAKTFKYHMVDSIALAAPTINFNAIMGDGKDFWPNDQHTAFEYQLLEQLQRLFSNGSMMRSWLENHHPTLGETPMDALRHPKGIAAVQSLLNVNCRP